ncbi:MAG: hypothetical protein JWP57_2898 [Spirosoma sp.]|nr:hypothetical protein [Spirosoma sp.]
MKAIQHLLVVALIAASTASFAQTRVSQEQETPTSCTVRPNKSADHIMSDFSLYVGFNNFGGSLPTGYDFSTIGSRFVALAWQKRIPLAVNGPTKLRLITGPEVAWNNFMFERSGGSIRNTLKAQNNQLVIESSGVALRKSKLVTTQLNLPVILNLSFKSGLTLGLGAYAGVRLDSYTKVKPETGSAVRTHGSFYLNTVRWGLTTELGFRGHANFFARYEPQSQFRAGQGPDASVWAVGIKL